MPANFLPSFLPPENSKFLKDSGATVTQYKHRISDNNNTARKFLQDQRSRLQQLSQGEISSTEKKDSPYYQIMARSLSLLNTSFSGANMLLPLQRLNIELNKSINSAVSENAMANKTQWQKQDFQVW